MNLALIVIYRRTDLFVKIVAVIFFIANSYSSAFGQREALEQTTFSTRVKNPIKVEAEGDDEKIIFFGVNNSFIPYQLEVEFTQMMNLDPTAKSYKTTIEPGRTRLFELRIRQKNSPTSYNYKINYVMGNPDAAPDADFPFLVPLSQNKKVGINPIHSIAGISPALFRVTTGDTIHAMRKGTVTAIREEDTELDRLTPASTEIYHRDGTLASYYGMDFRSLVKTGQSVYPGQPIGVLIREAVVSINVYQFFKNNQVRPIPIKYTTDGTSLLQVAQLNGIISAHPVEIIQKELTKGELKKWQKGSLYK